MQGISDKNLGFVGIVTSNIYRSVYSRKPNNNLKKFIGKAQF
jgi:hypothetical protein